MTPGCIVQRKNYPKRMRGHVTEGEGKQEEYREKSKQESDCTCVTMKAAP